jgi:single-strand DNA-binding protein
MDLNKAMLIGNVVRDPEIRQTAAGQPVASLAIATNMSWKDQQGQKQERADFHNIIAWRGLADVVSRFVKKGSKIYIEGRIQNRSWVGQDGQKRYTTEIVAENIIMLDRAGAPVGGGAPMGTSNSYNNTPRRETQNSEPTISYEEIAPTGGYDQPDIDPSNIPF